jgi:hypothetical protein
MQNEKQTQRFACHDDKVENNKDDRRSRKAFDHRPQQRYTHDPDLTQGSILCTSLLSSPTYICVSLVIQETKMSITYEEALATLEAMFAAPWTRETLDQVLRLEKGHMENTCDRILNHGSGDPQDLIDRLNGGEPEPQVAMDEELARQLAVGENRQSNASSSNRPAKKARGTPTELPPLFLRLPGYKPRAAAGSSGTGADMDDETLARMLQDELFSQELARNPDFAHLARGARGGSRGAAPATRGRASDARMPPRAAANAEEGPKIIEKLSGK